MGGIMEAPVLGENLGTGSRCCSPHTRDAALLAIREMWLRRRFFPYTRRNVGYRGVRVKTSRPSPLAHIS